MPVTAAEEITIGSHPTANILTDGFRTALEREPENAEAMAIHMEHTLRAFSPRNKFQLWLSDDVGLMLIRVDRIGRMDRRQRDQSALRAEFLWDHDRRLLAEDVGARLAKDPARVVKKLKATPQGCDWLAERWGWLQAVLDEGKTWSEDQTQAAVDLIGIAAGFREAATARLSDPAKLVREERAALEVQKAQVADADALERSLAMTDMIEPNTAEYRSLKQFERRTLSRIKWAMSMLEMIPKYADAHPAILDERGLQPLNRFNRLANELPAAVPPEVQEPTPPPPPLPQPWAQTTPPIPTPDLPPLPNPTTPAPTRSQRPDPAKLRAKTRSNAARQRREDRPDR